MADENVLIQMETFFLALADKTRLRLLNLMRDEEICVCFFTEVLGESQPKISRHLAYLRNAGVVSARRDGKWMHYSIVRPDDPNAARVMDEVLNWLDSHDELRADRERYEIVCCSPEALVQIAKTPMPFISEAPSSGVAFEAPYDESIYDQGEERYEEHSRRDALEDYLL